MGKLGAAAVATGVGGTGAAGVYGAHSMGVFGGGTKAKSVSALTEVMSGEKASNANKCLQEIFKDGTIGSGSLPSLNTPFTWKEGQEPTEACLVYSWEKKNQEQKYKESTFNLVWAISKGDEGVAVYLTATVQSKDEIKFEGVSYIFGKDEQGKWTAQKKLGMKEGQSHMILSSGDWKTKFPKIGDSAGTNSFSRKGIDSNYWYFLDNGGTQVSSEQTEHRRNNWWKWNNNSSSGIYKLKDWSSNFETWWNYFFGKDKLDMQKLMAVTNTFGSWSP